MKGSAHRGHVVILVDNDVKRDSRVQKQARSMADAGWRVTLLGQTPGKQVQRWRLGEAEVRLLPTPRLLHRRPGDLRRSRLRDPLAYSSGWLADTRAQAVRARQADLRVRRIEAGVGEVELKARLGLLPARLATKALDRWVALRADHTHRLSEVSRTGDSRLDRWTTAFWERVLGDAVWRRFDPHLWDWELAFGPEIDRLRPDLIHANDFRMLGVGARAAVRAREQGRRLRLVWDSHEFLPGIRPREDNPRWHLAQRAHERTYARCADAVVTVSDEVATMLRETHGLREQPAVVLNCPYAADTVVTGGSPSIREAVDAGPGEAVMVYSGVAAPQRGLDIMVEALPQLPEVICAFVVARPESEYVRSLVSRARELGVQDRVKLLPYVPFAEVVPFLSTADVGVIPIHHWPNHEAQLITKFFEYSHARLPIVVSDVRAMAHMTKATGQGEVFEAENLESFVGAVRAVLDEPERYRSAYDTGLLDEWTWEAQARILDRVYAGLLEPERS